MIDQKDNLYRIVWQTRPFLRNIEKVVEANLPTGVTVRTRAALEALLDGPATVPAIARKIEIKRQYTQLMVNEAIEAGLAETKPNPAHARSSLIELTASGRKLIVEIRGRETKILKEITKDLSPTEVAQAARVMDRLFHGFAELAAKDSQ